jgi:serine/threonine protein kinase
LIRTNRNIPGDLSLPGGPLVDHDPTSDGPRRDSDGASTLDLSGRCVGSSYILIRPIGQGATGTVWRGVDRASGEPVAVKLLHESLLRQPKLVTRFVQERTILLMLRHRNVVRVRDLFSVGESLGLVMDLVAGGSLREHLRERHTVPAGEAARLTAQVAAALAEAHELGIIHRDLKPDNILLLTENGELETRLTDFGIARVLNTPSLTTPNAVVGTPHYMSPEAFHGATASPAADIYALGVLLYEMVSGRPPYDSEHVADLMRQHLQGNPERRPGIPDPLWDVIESCLAQKPRLRPTAAELIAELSAVARTTATAPALPRPERCAPQHAPQHEPEPEKPVHPSAIVPAPRQPQRHNQVPGWRWARPGATLALIAGGMLASGLVTAAWNLGRADGDPGATQAAGPAASTDAFPPRTTTAGSITVSAAPAASGKPAASAAAGDGRVAANPTPPRVRATPATTAATQRRPAPVPEAKPYGPWQCHESLLLSFGRSPVLFKACHALGSRVQMKATIAAPAGGQATVSVALQDVATGRTAAAGKNCGTFTFADRNATRDCGPITAGVPHGHTYMVLLSWRYTRDGRTAGGTAKGTAFAW